MVELKWNLFRIRIRCPPTPQIFLTELPNGLAGATPQLGSPPSLRISSVVIARVIEA